MTPVIGILALQGAFREHGLVLRTLGAQVREVRSASDLQGLDGLAIPGGESTTMTNLMKVFSLTAALREFVATKPVLATCAGAILLARCIEDGPVEQGPLGLLDICVHRNAWGRQVHSFESPVELLPPLDHDGPSFPGVFIRAPRIVRVGPGATPIAMLDGEVVGVLQGTLMAFTFHPELTDDARVHRLFIDTIRNDTGASLDEGAPLSISSAVYVEV